jgi:hypothetical protein
MKEERMTLANEYPTIWVAQVNGEDGVAVGLLCDRKGKPLILMEEENMDPHGVDMFMTHVRLTMALAFDSPIAVSVVRYVPEDARVARLPNNGWRKRMKEQFTEEEIAAGASSNMDNAEFVGRMKAAFDGGLHE